MPASGAAPYALFLGDQLLGRFAASSLGDAALAPPSRASASLGEIGFELRDGSVTTSELEDWQLLAQNRGANAYRHDVVVVRTDGESALRWGFAKAFPTFYQAGTDRGGATRVALVRFVAERLFAP